MSGITETELVVYLTLMGAAGGLVAFAIGALMRRK